jgi:hypothetical protein
MTVDDALRAGHAAPPRAPAAKRPTVIVAGGGGALGAELLEQLLAGRAFAHVRVLVTQGFSATVQGLEPLHADALDDAAAPSRPLADIGIVVFDRERHANGRDAAFLRPAPDGLAALARRLHDAGVSDLVVVLPHHAALLPQALKVGLANLDEHAVAAIGFDHVVFVRSAQAPGDAAPGAGLQRLADLVLAQLRLMTPQALQPARAKKVAALTAALARALPGSTAGTRVLGPEQVWHAAQLPQADAFVRAWLAGDTLPPIARPRMRMRL